MHNYIGSGIKKLNYDYVLRDYKKQFTNINIIVTLKYLYSLYVLKHYPRRLYLILMAIIVL